MENQKTKKKDLLLVDPKNMVVSEGFNVRNDMGDLNALKESILDTGLQVPIKAKKISGEDKYQVIDGHRRLQAILLAIEEGNVIPYVEVINFTGTEEDQVISMLVTGTGQKPLTDVEQAEAIKRLTNFGFRVEDLAKKMGKSIPHAYYLLKISNLPQRVKNLIAEGYVSGLLAVQIFEDEEDEALAFAMLEMAIEEAQKSAKEGKPKKATKKDLDATQSEKKMKPIEILGKVMEVISEDNIENEKTALLTEVWMRINEGESPDDILLLLY
jgi:ParB family chromosome partitioning protein